MTKQRVFLSFERAVNKDAPILSSLTSKYGLVFSIFGATVNEEKQFVALELEGEDKKFGKRCNFFATLEWMSTFAKTDQIPPIECLARIRPAFAEKRAQGCL